jgi:hypothetical protein
MASRSGSGSASRAPVSCQPAPPPAHCPLLTAHYSSHQPPQSGTAAPGSSPLARLKLPWAVLQPCGKKSVFSMQGQASGRAPKTRSPILACSISRTSSSPKYNILPRCSPSWPLISPSPYHSPSSAFHFIDSSFHISKRFLINWLAQFHNTLFTFTSVSFTSVPIHL